MATVNRIVETEADRRALLRFLEGRPIPLTVTMTDGKHKTDKQNRLQRQWVMEIASQLGDRTPEQVRGECKLRFGVPILREENEAFRLVYDRLIKPHTYEEKLDFMMEPFDFGVTRIMTTRQKTEYLNRVHEHFSAQGIVLSNPEDLKFRGSAPSRASQAANDRRVA
jgi:hypothetical protein